MPGSPGPSLPDTTAGPGATAGGPDATAAGPDRLLATKLFAPRPPAGFVSRPRLVRRLDEGLARGLVLVCAPAGFGKTALLADWARDRPAAWLALDAADGDPVRFWRHLVAALDRLRPGLARRVAPALGPPAPAMFDGVATALINELTAAGDAPGLVLVLEDYHVIDSAAVHGSVTFLLEHRPPGLALIVTSRADPPLPLARARARGQLAELRADALRFTPDEAGTLLRSAAGRETDLSDASVAALAVRTEGWAAGLQLAALALHGRADVAGFVSTFSGSHRYVLDYLAEEVLDRQPGPVRRFLLETSVLDRLSAGLCDAVTGRSDGQAMLEALDRANLFIVPLDEERRWWRYHRLFADLLEARLRHEAAGRVAELHRNAAAWYERNGLADAAIRHALAAGEPGRAARLVEHQIDAFLLRNEEESLERWLAALPDEVAGTRPRLLLARADLALSHGRVDAAEQALDQAERVAEVGAAGEAGAPGESGARRPAGPRPAPEQAEGPYEPSVDAVASLVANVPAAVAFWRAYLAELRGDADAAEAFDRAALAALPGPDGMLASAARLHLQAVGLLRGDVRGAERGLRSAAAAFQAAGAVYPALRAIELVGHVERALGRLDAAADAYRLGLEIAAAPGRVPFAAAAIGHVGLADVAYQRDDLDSARDQAAEGVALARNLAYRRPLAAGLAVLARVRWARGDLAGAIEATGQDPHAAPSVGVTGLLDPLPALRARLLLAAGDRSAAVRWTQERGLDPDDDPGYPREPEYLVLARLLLAQDLPGRAVALLGRLRARAERQGRLGSVLEIDALLAVARAAAGEEAGALATLHDALALAHPQGYLRLFVDEGAPMRTLLGCLIAERRDRQPAAPLVPLRYLGRLLRAVGADGTPAGAASRRRGAGIPGLVEGLSEREVDVLRLLAEGRSNQAIAAELFVALDTVKKHVSHVLAKLGASNRTEATARARELGLLDLDDGPPGGAA